MSGKRTKLGYINIDTPIHRLTGASKLVMVLFASLGAMLTFDTRLLIFIVFLSMSMFVTARIPFSEMKLVITFLAMIMFINIVVTYLFSPEEGVRIYGSRTEIVHIIGRYYLTWEQIFFQFNQTLKYLAILPLALIFFFTTEPSEFAASLNKIKVNYKIAYAVTLALRYIPAVQREYMEVSQAQQARGVDISKNVKLSKRVSGMAKILFPLIITSIDKIDRISNAMELRSFGKNRSRTWYHTKAFRFADYAVMVASGLLIVAAIVLFFVNSGRFFNPFLMNY